MLTLTEPCVEGISLTKAAAARLKELKKQENILNGGVRFDVEKGFCGEGYDYLMDFVQGPSAEDQVFFSHGLEIYVPQGALEKLFGSEVDYDPHAANGNFENILKKGFLIHNPNAKGACPCACNRGFDF